MTEGPTLTSDDASAADADRLAPESLGLCIAWCPPEPGRAGEVGLVPPARDDAAFTLGRGHAPLSDGSRRVDFARYRAHAFEPGPALASPKLSRVQLRIEPRGTRQLLVRNVGRCPLWHNGARVDEAAVVPGDTLRLGQELLLLCVRRRAWDRPHKIDPHAVPFGRADASGIVGESPAAWELRRQIAFVAAQGDHVLVCGESGTGKELVARAVHRLSSRAVGPFVARNAATFPEGLVDAELFGHARNYPGPGMPERQGLLGEAAGGVLFLDELSELPAALQTHLLRVLDHGEYQRLGEGAARVSDTRFIAATNRPEGLRADLAARFRLTVRMPPLRDRIEDVSLIAAGRLRTLAASSPSVASRFLGGPSGDGEPRLSLAFVDALLRHAYTTNVRELEAILWEALSSSARDVLECPPSLAQHAPASPPRTEHAAAASERAVDPKTLTRAAIEGALAANDGSIERTWRSLGLGSRHVLTRLMAKLGTRREPLA